MDISFGSDGFRGIIGQSFTLEAVARISLGAAKLARNEYTDADRPQIPIGYDTRFLSKPMAHFAAGLLAEEGFEPLLASRPCPSPYLAFATRHLDAPIGIQFTASHNPSIYNGIKLKGRHGGSLLPKDARMVQHYAREVDADRLGRVERNYEEGEAQTFDLEREYRRAVGEAAGWDGDPDLPIVVDFMHGSSAGVYRDVLAESFLLNTALRLDADPLFGGGRPEPLKENLGEMSQRVAFDGHGSVGLAFDGDGDRLAVIDEGGSLLASHEVFCLLLEHLVSSRGQSGVVVASVSFSGLVRRVAESLDCKVIEVPVGFKSVTEAMLEHQALIGGEETGGTGFGHYLPERDALLMALILLRARQEAKTTLREMVEKLYARFGRPAFLHRDIPLPPSLDASELPSRILELASLEKLAGDPIVSLGHIDGMKLRTKRGWVLARLSGTEPLLRIFAEAESEEQAAAYADAATKFLGLG
ncbi:hypothetical protein IIA79_06380 [bacterium]|nr:hypothetical protein [bacterium]